ncbi:hypothetical protein H696_06378 [Fonticula alba]|uniref:Uncharacterized protein n=1 Tax=Fonticula alba TaxID=691883 RepID=A0A058Z0Y5_FONAL|nr:hypothetical protein H696_06378 [Fonticula alba]KCV67202.1 hypothetical protein H696_06378 [Fonticula alba]|eukprot:XP_009498393.1 hypothetical protein H696_06378 [Fonticula alba]
MAPPISEYGVVASVRTLIPNAAAPNGPRHPGVLQIFRRAPRQGDGPFGVDRPAEALLRWVPWVRDSG